jgi:APA family basic amino acid/polyamine antiporter
MKHVSPGSVVATATALTRTADSSVTSVRKVAPLNAHGPVGLERTMSVWSLMALGIGSTIGAGIFVLTGTAAATNAGPAIGVSFMVSGLVCAFAGLCYAEMASSVPASGSAYTYAYATMGQLVAWIIGWDLILEYALGASAVAVGWSGYVVSFLHDLGITIPPALTSAPFAYDAATGDWTRTVALVNLPAMVVTAGATVLLYLGTRESVRVNDIIVVLKVAIVLIFIFAGVWFVSSSNWVTAGNPGGAFIPPNAGAGQFGWSGILRGAAVVFFAYIGFDAVSTAAQEAKNPQRDMPIGIIGSLVVCTILYVLVGFVITGIIPYDKLNVPDPIALGIDAIGLGWLSPIIKLGAILGLSSVILVGLLGQTRILFAMAQDRLLPAVFASVHATFRTPHVNVVVTGVIVTVLAGLLPLELIGELVSIGTLFAFAVVCLGVLALRVARPDLKRPFRTPAVWFVAPAGIASSIFLMFGLPGDTWLRLAVWLVAGLLIYVCYGRRHGRSDKTILTRQVLTKPAAALS